jgi:hypothetical protein
MTGCIVCEECGRSNQYQKRKLAERGPEIPLPDLRVEIARCKRKGKMHDACGVHYEGLT